MVSTSPATLTFPPPYPTLSAYAEDIAQETFLRAWQGLGGFRAESQLRTWLYRITANLCYNRLPRLRDELEALDPAGAIPLSQTGSVEAHLLTAEIRQQIYTAIDNLPALYRLLVTLRHMDGYTYREIAGITQMPLGTVKSVLFRARRQLRQALATYEETVDG